MKENILASLFTLTFFSFLGSCYGIYLQYKRNIQDRASVDAENAFRNAKLESLQLAQHETLYGGKGREGEKRVAAAVDQLMGNLGAKWCTNESMEFPNAILLPEGDDPFSKELDLVLLCDFGLFVFEIKDWHGTWQQSDDPMFIETVRGNGELDKRPAPLLKTQKKLALLKRKFGHEVPSEALVIFTDPASSLSAKLPEQYMHLNELGHYFRAKRDNSKANVDAFALMSDLENCFDGQNTALHMQMMRLSPSNELIKGYQVRDRQIAELKSMPRLGYPEKESMVFVSRS
jgi:Nuclease-related domain